MDSLDPDDPRPPFQQVAAALRAAILTRKIEPGDRLPTQKELADRYGVARATVQQSLRLLKDEGLVMSRQGSGMFARERPVKAVGLQPHLEAAFEVDDVRIDFVGYTSESLNFVLVEPLNKIRSGRLEPKSIRIRLLVADMTKPHGLPVATSGDEDESARARARMAGIGARNAGAIADAVGELGELGLVPNVKVETRSFASSPLFKAYLINDSEAFFGYYPVVERDVQMNGDTIRIFDPKGKDATLFHHADDGDPESIGSLFVAQTKTWFESVWNTVAVEVER
ncbi:GntR family transcriptional regulator [Myceligenerans halotolerans]